MGRAAFVAVASVLLSGAAWAQDVPPGQLVFGQCRACHQVGVAAKNAVGPVLNGLFGRAAGSMAGFTYSEAARTSGIVWDAAVFTDYIRNPRARLPGTKMVFTGLRNDQQIADLILYLERFGPDGKTIP